MFFKDLLKLSERLFTSETNLNSPSQVFLKNVDKIIMNFLSIMGE